MSDFVHGDQADRRHPHEKQPVHDVESAHGYYGKETVSGVVSDGSETEEQILARELQRKKGFFRTLRRGEEWLDKKMGIETQGIDRIHEEDKQPPSIWNVFLLWWSMTCHVGTLPIGILGPDPEVFGLSLQYSVAAIVLGTFLGAACTGFCGTLGPKLGLRAIATSRYSFGFYGAKLCSVLNVVIGGGFMVVNTVVVGQILAAVSDYTMSLEVGIVIISVIGYVVSIFGFRLVHTYEKYSWIATSILFCVLIGQTAPLMQTSTANVESGLPLSGAFLSFLTLNFSSASGWCSIASDYYCNYPAKTKPWKMFTLTILGISLSTCFATIIGACVGSAVFAADANENPVNASLSATYAANGLGGALRDIYHPLRFAKFCLVLLTFSVLGNNIAVNYSSGLSIQLLGHYFHAVPRFVWSFLNALVIAILAIAGREHLSLIVSNFVSLLGYWTVSFTAILFVEDKFFRRKDGYELSYWDQAGKLPWGLAAVISLLTGYLAGGVTGMAQTWYYGPIALKFGPYGGDVGVFLSFAFTLVTYPPLRWYEKKKTGR